MPRVSGLDATSAYATWPTIGEMGWRLRLTTATYQRPASDCSGSRTISQRPSVSVGVETNDGSPEATADQLRDQNRNYDQEHATWSRQDSTSCLSELLQPKPAQTSAKIDLAPDQRDVLAKHPGVGRRAGLAHTLGGTLSRSNYGGLIRINCRSRFGCDSKGLSSIFWKSTA